MVDAFAISLGARMSAAFPLAEVEFDGQCLSLYHHVSYERFVHAVVDFSCLDEDNEGCVAVHARPDHLFRPHWEENEACRTLVTVEGVRFEGGDGQDGHEYPDEFGNTMWSFNFPGDEDSIATLAVALATLSTAHFAE
jgi:hypothetical protein